MKKIESLGRILVLNAYWIGLSFKWNALHPIILPAILLNFVPETQKNTYLGGLTFAGLLLAMVVQPVAGAVSDGWRSRWGRRRATFGGGRPFWFSTTDFLTEHGHEKIGEDKNIVPAIAQRGKIEGDNRQSKVEVFSKAFGLNKFH
jgi:hypothetical protein